MFDVRALFATLAARLWAIYHNHDGGPRLILPTKRDSSRRVSEQESKILACRELERTGTHYSIETPTIERYSQSGQGSLSARIDVTVYGSPDPADRVLNLELKAHTADVEAFRKDFEKLLREKTPGAWFHTLERTTPATWRALERHALEALRLVSEHADIATHSVIFGFCELHNPQLAVFELHFGAGWTERFETEFQRALDHPMRPSWRPATPTAPRLRTQPTGPRTYGEQRKLLVYCPEIDPATVLHLSIRGESYALRAYSADGVRRWVVSDAPTTSSLFERYRIEEISDVAAERRSLDSERSYWSERIRQANLPRLGQP